MNDPHPHRAPAWLQDLAGAWVFYSVLPAWPGIEPRFVRIARFAPWIGLVLGGLQGLLWWLTSGWLPPLAQISLVIALGLWLSGGLHADGVIDTADGLAAGSRALEAMDDSRAGAAGVQALVVLLLLRAAGLAALAAAAGPALVAWALLLASIWGRISPLVAMARFPYLRPGGTAGFHRQGLQRLRRELLPALALLVLLAVVPLLWSVSAGKSAAAVLPWLAPVLLPVLPAVWVPWWLGRRLGGHSGDTYGACVEWSETLGLLLSGVVISALVAHLLPAG
ncbi:MAG: adenosylcobinamide-GDP ribazoletransferase [Cyanobacteriota bacterium]|nr:adenosylcobinamide-GDP ribazoletransferase [Cyanobacteriota bacterium]